MTHKDASATLSGRAFTTKAFNLAIRVDLVVLQDRHLDLLALVLDLLGGLKICRRIRLRYSWTSRVTYGVGLLFALLGTTTKTKDEMKSRLLLDVVVTESTTILELLASED